MGNKQAKQCAKCHNPTKKVARKICKHCGHEGWEALAATTTPDDRVSLDSNRQNSLGKDPVVKKLDFSSPAIKSPRRGTGTQIKSPGQTVETSAGAVTAEQGEDFDTKADAKSSGVKPVSDCEEAKASQKQDMSPLRKRSSSLEIFHSSTSALAMTMAPDEPSSRRSSQYGKRKSGAVP